MILNDIYGSIGDYRYAFAVCMALVVGGLLLAFGYTRLSRKSSCAGHE